MRKTKTLDMCSIVDGVVYFEDVRQCRVDDDFAADIFGEETLTSIRLVSLSSDWQIKVWYPDGSTAIEHIDMEMTLRKEKKERGWYWYAYRRVFGKLHKRYVGTSDAISSDKLLEIARKMPRK